MEGEGDDIPSCAACKFAQPPSSDFARARRRSAFARIRCTSAFFSSLFRNAANAASSSTSCSPLPPRPSAVISTTLPSSSSSFRPIFFSSFSLPLGDDDEEGEGGSKRIRSRRSSASVALSTAAFQYSSLIKHAAILLFSIAIS